MATGELERLAAGELERLPVAAFLAGGETDVLLFLIRRSFEFAAPPSALAAPLSASSLGVNLIKPENAVTMTRTMSQSGILAGKWGACQSTLPST